jgi:hypothetical protein
MLCCLFMCYCMAYKSFVSSEIYQRMFIKGIRGSRYMVCIKRCGNT